MEFCIFWGPGTQNGGRGRAQAGENLGKHENVKKHKKGSQNHARNDRGEILSRMRVV